MALLGGGVLALAFSLYAAHVFFDMGGEGIEPVFDHWLYAGLMAGSSIACLARAASRPEQRTAWALIGLALLGFALGDIYWNEVISDNPGSTFFSPADAGYLAFYPLALAGIVLIVSDRLRGRSPGLWLDAATVALAVATIGSAIVIEAVAEGLGDDLSALAEGLTYPIADILLLAFLAAVVVITGRRPGAAVGLLVAGLAVTGLADAVYAYELSAGNYVEGTWLDLLWPGSALLIAAAAWAPAREPVTARPPHGWRVLLVSGTVGAAVCALYIYERTIGSDPVSDVLLLLTTLAVLARLALAFGENQRLITRIGHDPLTGLPNRGQLEIDLREAITGDSGAHVLGLLDLDGFKRYNDSFGHPAGDALLERLARRLDDSLGGAGSAYRVGGDEFCVLVNSKGDGAAEKLDGINVAFSERGHGFEVSSSLGLVELPREAESPEAAIQLADRRMYERKSASRLTAEEQAVAVLRGAQRERAPELSIHTDDVSELAVAVGRHIGLDIDELALLERAAELHDIGKVAIPDAILEKAGPLTESERAFIRRHPVVGERIAASAPDLIPAARIIRSSHECFDGSGYPDGLEGDEIPIASQIIHICDAYCAMTRPRPYSTAVSPREALLELRRCAATQFDPVVVAAFGQSMAQGGPALAPAKRAAESDSLAGWFVPRPRGLAR
ncbi:MAG: HD domain-containing phosphohydrolase [Solirubrobacterales bacterium]